MPEEDLLKVFGEILAQVALEVIRLLPKILITLVIFIITSIMIRAVNAFLGKMFKLARVDDAFNRFSGFHFPSS